MNDADLWQIIDGLVYLEKQELEHSKLECCNILVDLDGNVKICKSDSASRA